MITVDGFKYKVVENLGYQAGYQAKVVETPDGEKVVVKRGGIWTWWTVADRLQSRGRYEGQEAVSPQGKKE